MNRRSFVLVQYARRRVIARLLRLSPPRYAVEVQRRIAVPMPDGVRLFSDHYAPRGVGDFPTVLIRTPYGRGHEMRFGAGLTLAEMPGQRFAERGYHVIVQGVRGCFESEGTFVPHAQEAADGAATAAWIAAQPWFNGKLATWGPSYLGYAQWATADAVPDAISAMLPIVTSAENFSVSHPDGAFGLETRLRWAQGMFLLDHAYRGTWRARFTQAVASRAAQHLRDAFAALPLLEADTVAVGEPLPSYRATLNQTQADAPFWQSRDHTAATTTVTAPIHLVGGWYDYYLRGILRDYEALRAAGRQPHLTIGPWYHASAGTLTTGLHEGLRWFDFHLRGIGTARPKPVQVFVMGANEWRSLDDFPPPADLRHYFLHADQVLAPTPPPAHAPPDCYRYDPADPTPAIGGALLSLRGAGAQDNRVLEARCDVLTYTTPPLASDLEIVGWVRLELFVRSSLEHTDFFGRLCDVHPNGQSVNICDGLVRLVPGEGELQTDGSRQVVITFSATAHRFLRGHCLCLQVSSGAHPRWSRNLGTDEPLATGTQLRVAEQTVYHDSQHPSALVLPVSKP